MHYDSSMVCVCLVSGDWCYTAWGNPACTTWWCRQAGCRVRRSSQCRLSGTVGGTAAVWRTLQTTDYWARWTRFDRL